MILNPPNSIQCFLSVSFSFFPFTSLRNNLWRKIFLLLLLQIKSYFSIIIVIIMRYGVKEVEVSIHIEENKRLKYAALWSFLCNFIWDDIIKVVINCFCLEKWEKSCYCLLKCFHLDTTFPYIFAECGFPEIASLLLIFWIILANKG